MGSHAGNRVLDVRGQYGGPLDVFIVKEAVGAQGVGPVATGTGDAGCGFGAQLLHQANGAPITSGVAQIETFKFSDSPTHFYHPLLNM